jgi:hypothetical protein
MQAITAISRRVNVEALQTADADARRVVMKDVEWILQAGASSSSRAG